MNMQDIQNVGASQEAVAQNNNASFAEKAKDVAAKVAFGTIATACTVSAIACAACRIVKLVRLIRGDEK